MYRIKTYLLNSTIKYILINQLIILFFIIFINLIELSRIIEKDNHAAMFGKSLSMMFKGYNSGHVKKIIFELTICEGF